MFQIFLKILAHEWDGKFLFKPHGKHQENTSKLMWKEEFFFFSFLFSLVLVGEPHNQSWINDDPT